MKNRKKIKGAALIKSTISHLLIVLRYQPLCQSNANKQYPYLVVGYEINIIRIAINLNENIITEGKHIIHGELKENIIVMNEKSRKNQGGILTK